MFSSHDCQRLAALGWTPFFDSQAAELDLDSSSDSGSNSNLGSVFDSAAERRRLPERVISSVRGELVLAGVAGQRRATLAGRLVHDTPSDGLPLVGDWVLAEPAPPAAGRVIHVFERSTVLRRQAPGGTARAQGMVANADTGLIVAAFGRPDADPHALSHALNPRRLERYVALLSEAQITPVVVLNKSDLVPDAGGAIAELERRLEVTVVAVSAERGDGLARLFEFLPAPRTALLLGSSGVGKSSLTNRLLGTEAQRVLEVRETDARGRHATTRRELFSLPNGAFLIDTPGMRELGVLAGDHSDAALGFHDVAALARACRFRDCRHEDEPDCAVLAAVARGELESDRLRHAKKLEREAARQRALGDALLGRESKRKRRVFARHLRATLAAKKRGD